MVNWRSTVIPSRWGREKRNSMFLQHGSSIALYSVQLRVVEKMIGKLPLLFLEFSTVGKGDANNERQ
jgi:hypothetical protein